MNTAFASAQTAPLSADPPQRDLGLAILLIVTALLAFAPVAVLGAAIGWPGSLRWPAAQQLAAIAAAPDAVAAGYGLYLLCAQIELLFTALSSYGGGIGELLGVSLLMAAALATLCLGAWRQGRMPAWLAAPGLLSAALLLGLFMPSLRLPVQVPMATAVTLLSIWMLAAAAWCLRRR